MALAQKSDSDGLFKLMDNNVSIGVFNLWAKFATARVRKLGTSCKKLQRAVATTMVEASGLATETSDLVTKDVWAGRKEADREFLKGDLDALGHFGHVEGFPLYEDQVWRAIKYFDDLEWDKY